MPNLTRRSALVAAGLLPLMPRLARAAEPIGQVAEVTGQAALIHLGEEVAMTAGMPVEEGDTAATGEQALALLILKEDTKINMGPATTVVLAKYLADVGGTIQIGGAILFDRPEDRPPVDLTFETEYGQIGVRGTRFFVGPSKGEYAVFCDRGSVTVSNMGVTRELKPGDGVNMAVGAAPSDISQWGAPRIQAAFESVGVSS